MRTAFHAGRGATRGHSPRPLSPLGRVARAVACLSAGCAAFAALAQTTDAQTTVAQTTVAQTNDAQTTDAQAPDARTPLARTPDILVATHPGDDAAPVKQLGIVTVTGARPTSLPSQIPTTIEGITGAEVEEKINATDAEDALKYFPSLLVRERYVGDFNHAVLSSRASGTGNSARSIVYADGILLSNFLGNGAAFTPRWGLVTPEEIERVDVLYGPFSAAYPGNSVGAVVDYQTRMPRRFEVHARLGAFTQPFELYRTKETFNGWQASMSLGDRAGPWSWWVTVNRTDSKGQPLTFGTKLLRTGTATTDGTPVTGAVLDRDKSNDPWWIIGTATQYRTVQDHGKVKLAFDITPDVRAAYTVGAWHNRAVSSAESYLRAPDGSAFFSGTANIGGQDFNITPADLPSTRDAIDHYMHGLSVGSHSRGVFDWQVAVSRYEFNHDRQRTATVARPAADTGGAGRITDLDGTGWDTISLKGTWRPGGQGSAHQVDFGLQQERYRWRQAIHDTGDWISAGPTTPISSFRGDTRLQSAYAQDAWQVNPRWKTVLGARFEHWTASGGSRTTGTGAPVAFEDRSEDFVSPKAAVGYQLADDVTLKLSTGRAVRMPTVGELFQGAPGTIVNDPDLKPERSWTTELSAEWTADTHRLRTTLFHEDTRDALYAQAIPGTTPIVNSTQNVDRIRTIGLEAAFDATDLVVDGIDLMASLTYADSEILDNASFVSTPGDTIGKRQPRVPKWRASLLATWRPTERLTATFGARYGSSQFGTLNNSDPNGFTYQGFSKYFTTDLRVHYRIDKRWSVAAGIDNLNNYKYWNFHPYPQRTYSAELRFDL